MSACIIGSRPLPFQKLNMKSATRSAWRALSGSFLAYHSLTSSEDGGSRGAIELPERSFPEVDPIEGLPRREAEATLAIIRTELRMDACPSSPTLRKTWKRRFQAKKRVAKLGNGFSKQRNA